MTGPLIRAAALDVLPRVLPGARVARAIPVAERAEPPGVPPHPSAILEQATPDTAPEPHADFRPTQVELRRREMEIEHRYAQAEAAFAAAERAGHEEGLRRAAHDARHEFEQRVAEVAALLQDLRQARERHEQALMREAVPLLMEAAARVFGELGRSEAGAVAAVRAALQHVRTAETVTLRVNPKHLPWLRQAAEQGDLGKGGPDLNFVADAEVVGGCVVMGEAGGVDASLDTQLARLAEVLHAARPGERDGE